MTKRRLFSMLLMLVSMVAWAEVSTWTHKWDTSKSSGGEGFYHITSNDETTQTTTLKLLEWTYSGNTSVTAYTGTAGQYFGSATNPVTHATLSTDKLQGKILSVTVNAKKKDGATVEVVVSVNGVAYGEARQLTTAWADYKFLPTGDAQEGAIVITMDQTSETKGPIYFLSLTIEYDGPGIAPKEPQDPELSYPIQEVTIEKGDNAPANPLSNPHNVSPITYSCANTNLAVVVSSTGAIWTTGYGVGTTTVTATFAGNDDYKPATATYTLVVKEKPVIPAPTVTPAGGTFTEPVTVTITSDDPLCKAIWYSTSLTDVEDMGYDERTIIVPGNTATVTIDDTCKLLAVAVGDNNVGLPALYEYTVNLPLKADFTAEESAQTYYSMGWDSMEEASTWKYYGISQNTWTLYDQPLFTTTPAFTAIDPASEYSLTIFYTTSNQRERAVSPQIEVKESSKAEFYLCFGGVWLVYANLKFVVNDITDGTSHTLFNAFNWAQAHEFTGPSWEKFDFDLAQFAGHTCTFEFIYEGSNGDDMAIDGFKLKKEDASQDAKINVFQGEQVHFKDLSQGHPTAWAWTVSGAETMTSTEQNPVFTFNKAGTYNVTLKVSKGAETNEKTKAEYVVVSVAAPKAHIGLPEGVYMSPYAYAFVPTNTPLTFKDLSEGTPTSWAWTFEGADPATSSEQNPTVTYAQEGTYGMTLTVTNAAGEDKDFLVNAIQAGGEQEVWNITPEESSTVAGIQLGWYGSYAGSNWLGMVAFAEKFEKPITKASISGVSVYFDNTVAEDMNAEVEVAIYTKDVTGVPGESLASKKLKISELAYSSTEVLATEFTFDAPIEIEDEFFVVISDFPNEGNDDNVNILCVNRPAGARSTTFHLLEDEDEHYNPLGTYTWIENTDDPVSMCVAPVMKYVTTPSAVEDVTIATETGATVTGVYDILGRRLSAPQRGFNIVNGKKVMVK